MGALTFPTRLRTHGKNDLNSKVWHQTLQSQQSEKLWTIEVHNETRVGWPHSQSIHRVSESKHYSR